jgi:hypothetical protein
MIVPGDTPKEASQWFDSVQEVGEVGHLYAMRQEHFKILLCRNPKQWHNLKEVWPRIKNYN